MARAGRPRLSSRRVLEDAAQELFLEQGYRGTTVDHIARRAGVGRNTFFNYFDSKSDVLWIDTDDVLGALPDAFAGLGGGVPVAGRAAAALADAVGAEPRVPWAVTQRELLDLDGALAASGAERALCLAEIVRLDATRAGAAAGAAGAYAAAAAGVAFAEALAWAEAGTARGDLAARLAAGLGALASGFAGPLAGAPDVP